jgi:Porin subfamily
VTSPRAPPRSLKSWKINYLRLGSFIKRASPPSGLSATHWRKPHPALFKVSLHDCVWFTRDLTNDINYRVRGAISWDVRQQTEYGTLRSYIRFGAENTTPNATGAGTTFSPFWDRAFIQFAGFTVGRSQSFFDLVPLGQASGFSRTDPGGRVTPPVLTSSNRFRQFIDGSLALASLHLTRRDVLPTLTATLTTIALDDSSLQRFEART